MNRNFFIRLTFAAHRVADALPASPHASQGGPQEERVGGEIRETANEILTNLIILFDKETTRHEKKHDRILQLRRQVDILLVYLDKAKKGAWMKQENFTLLETEYRNIHDLLAVFADIHGPKEEKQSSQVQPSQQDQIVQALPKSEKSENSERSAMLIPQDFSGKKSGGGLTQRQRRIVEFLRAKQKAQVWELQKVLPEVTKRTLRRDLDELLQKNLVERKGEWNAVSYELK